MITSFSRLFRQIFGGSQAQPATEALSRDIGAEGEAREAAEHRENLKRAMEAAFATPTAAADAPQAPPVAELQAAAEVAAAAIATQEAEPEVEDLAQEAPEPQEAATDEAPVAEPVEVVAQALEAAPAELPPAIELAEVEAPTEHDIEVVEWDIAKLVDEPATPTVEHRADKAIEDDRAVTADIEGVAQPVEASATDENEEEVEHEQSAASDTAKPEPELTAEFVAAATKPKRTKRAKAPAKKKTSSAKKKAAAKKTAAKKTAALPEDAVWLSDAIAFSLKGEWSSVWTPPEDASGAERLEAFREKAAAGEIVIWGRPDDGEAWEPAKPAYWKTALVEPLSFLMGRENVVTDPKASKAKKPVKFTALKVARSQVEALWPPAKGEVVRDAA